MDSMQLDIGKWDRQCDLPLVNGIVDIHLEITL